ncbi:MAG: glutaredoxin domain-containing protein [Pseudomonadota bacterium]
MRTTLYQTNLCGFCGMVRRAIGQLGLADAVAERYLESDAEGVRELSEGGGLVQVPCLRIERDGEPVQWLYESMDIIDFLKENADRLKAAG